MAMKNCMVNTNLNECEIFDESYKSKITFLAKITKMPTQKSNNYIEAYFFTSHDKKYILKSEIVEPFMTLATIDINIQIRKVNDFFDAFITELDKSNVIFSIPEEKQLYLMKGEPNKYKTNILTIDTSNESPGVRSKTNYENVSYIDFVTYLGRSEKENIKTDYVNIFLKSTISNSSLPRPAFKFADGTTLSIQVGTGLYSSPRTSNAEIYQAVECGFPSKPIPQLEEYKEIPDEKQEDSVFPYVPVEVINDIIEEKGIDKDFMNKYMGLTPENIMSLNVLAI